MTNSSVLIGYNCQLLAGPFHLRIDVMETAVTSEFAIANCVCKRDEE